TRPSLVRRSPARRAEPAGCGPAPLSGRGVGWCGVAVLRQLPTFAAPAAVALRADVVVLRAAVAVDFAAFLVVAARFLATVAVPLADVLVSVAAPLAVVTRALLRRTVVEA